MKKPKKMNVGGPAVTGAPVSPAAAIAARRQSALVNPAAAAIAARRGVTPPPRAMVPMKKGGKPGGKGK